MSLNTAGFCIVCHASIPAGVAHACAGHPPASNLPAEEPKLGRYSFTPNQLTEADIRRIIREELDRQPRRDDGGHNG